MKEASIQTTHTHHPTSSIPATQQENSYRHEELQGQNQDKTTVYRRIRILQASG